MSDSLQHRLQERVKELTALHRTARLLQDTGQPVDAVLPAVAALLPPAWQHPDIAAGRIRCGDRHLVDARTSARSPWRQRETFRLRDGETGAVEVVYLQERPAADEGPFLAEERELIRSLAEMLRAYFQHRRDDEAILAANERLERQVAERTASLRRLAAEVCLAEERERRAIAADLHDHLGQGLALIRIRLQRLRGDAVLGGHGPALDELVALSDQAIRYTRGLTFELSPPVLYELGLGPALEWLGEETARKHDLQGEGARPRQSSAAGRPEGHALEVGARAPAQRGQARRSPPRGDHPRGPGRSRIVLEVADDGCGFDVGLARRDAGERFGLFSIEERLRQLGGHLELDTAPGRGTRVRLVVGPPGGEP